MSDQAVADSAESSAVASAPAKTSALSQVADVDSVPPLNAENLVDAGVHYGHSTRYWNPKMKRWIFGKKSGVHIINIKETIRSAVRARYFLKQIASAGLDVLIVGTKRQAEDVIRAEAARCDMPFVASRWLGGTLTNHATVRSRLKRLEEIEDMKASRKFESLGKKLQSMIEREHKKVAFNFEGLRNLEKLPSALLVVDTDHEKNAIAEARKLNIPIVGIVDTNCDPDGVDIVIPANDDSLRGIQILLHYIVDGIIEGTALNKQGAGLKDRSGLQVSHYSELGPTSRDKRRQGRDRKGGGRSRSRTEGRREKVDDAAQEAVKTAEAQTRGAAAQVRTKPRRQEGDKSAAKPAEGAPKSDAPAAEAPKSEAPAAEAPKPEAPAQEAPKAEAPAPAPEAKTEDKPSEDKAE